MNSYRVLYRPLHKFVDTIIIVEAKDTPDLLKQLVSRGVPLDVQFMYVHEQLADGKVKEVITYERDKDEPLTHKPKIKPRVKLKAADRAAFSLSGKWQSQGLYTAYEVTCPT